MSPPPEPCTLSGSVTRDDYAVGSKSERAAVMLDAGDARYVLRRQGANPFEDHGLDDLVGHTVEVTGIIHGHTFLVTDWAIDVGARDR